MELRDALRHRRMIRSFDGAPLGPELLGPVLRAALRGPSAGYTQAVELVVLEDPDDRAAFWEAETDPGWRAAHPGHTRTRRAPVIVLPVTGADPYLRRYSEPDKAGSALGREEAWPVPFWWVDAGAAVMAMLLAAADLGLASLFMGVFRGEDALQHRFGWPSGLRPVGAVLLGRPAPDVASPSLARGRRDPASRIHAGGYGRPWPA